MNESDKKAFWDWLKNNKVGTLESVWQAALAYRDAQPAQGQQGAVGSEWTPCMKLPVVVHVRQQREGESHVSTREGITPVRPDDLIMRGVSGEEYPIGKDIFEKTYTLNTTPPASPDVVKPFCYLYFDTFRKVKICQEEPLPLNAFPVFLKSQPSPAAPDVREQPPIWFMHENHTFTKLSDDLETAMKQIETAFDARDSYGSVCSNREGFIMINAHGKERKQEFLDDCRAALTKHGDKA